MFVLGVDPGLSRCGYGVVERAPGHGRSGLRAVAAGVITTPVEDGIPWRLAALGSELRALLAEYAPAVVVVERVLFQANARTAMGVGQASGMALATAADAGAEVVEYSPNEVKMAVTGYGAATKAQVQAMVQKLLGLEVMPRPPDVADALALAICHLGGASLARAAALAEHGRGALAEDGRAGGRR
jgi:crossover junction endodeoxyribonuclease RuvC